MDAKAAMYSGAINTEEDPIGNRSPSRILSIAIKAHLVVGLGFEFSEDKVLVGEAVGPNLSFSNIPNPNSPFPLLKIL